MSGQPNTLEAFLFDNEDKLSPQEFEQNLLDWAATQGEIVGLPPLPAALQHGAALSHSMRGDVRNLGAAPNDGDSVLAGQVDASSAASFDAEDTDDGSGSQTDNDEDEPDQAITPTSVRIRPRPAPRTPSTPPMHNSTPLSASRRPTPAPSQTRRRDNNNLPSRLRVLQQPPVTPVIEEEEGVMPANPQAERRQARLVRKLRREKREDREALGYVHLFWLIEHGSLLHLQAFLRVYAGYYRQKLFSPRVFLDQYGHRFSGEISTNQFEELCNTCGLSSMVTTPHTTAKNLLGDYKNEQWAAVEAQEKNRTQLQKQDFDFLTDIRRKKELLRSVQKLIDGTESIERYLKNEATQNVQDHYQKLMRESWNVLSMLHQLLEEEEDFWIRTKNLNAEGVVEQDQARRRYYLQMIAQFELQLKNIKDMPYIPMIKPGYGREGPFRTAACITLAATGLTFSAIFGYCAFFSAVALLMTPVGWMMSAILLGVCSLLAIACLAGSIYAATRPFHSLSTHGRVFGHSTNLKNLQEDVVEKGRALIENKSTTWERFKWDLGKKWDYISHPSQWSLPFRNHAGSVVHPYRQLDGDHDASAVSEA